MSVHSTVVQSVCNFLREGVDRLRKTWVLIGVYGVIPGGRIGENRLGLRSKLDNEVVTTKRKKVDGFRT